MNHRVIASMKTLTVAISVLSLPVVPLMAQSNAQTPWGHPDLQGTWTNGNLTPLQRPDDVARKELLHVISACGARAPAAMQPMTARQAGSRTGSRRGQKDIARSGSAPAAEKGWGGDQGQEPGARFGDAVHAQAEIGLVHLQVGRDIVAKKRVGCLR